ncbi:MAG: hypothetical protein ACFCVK_07205 [Acidimicrobiales bacterium]
MDADAPVGRTSWSIRDAVEALRRADTELLAVTGDDDSNLVGMVRESEIVKLDEILLETQSTDAVGER